MRRLLSCTLTAGGLGHLLYQDGGKNVVRVLGNFRVKFGQTVGLGGIISKYWHNVFIQISRLFEIYTVRGMLEKFVEKLARFWICSCSSKCVAKLLFIIR